MINLVPEHANQECFCYRVFNICFSIKESVIIVVFYVNYKFEMDVGILMSNLFSTCASSYVHCIIIGGCLLRVQLMYFIDLQDLYRHNDRWMALTNRAIRKKSSKLVITVM